MSGLVRLAARWLAFHRGRTLLLVGCLALAFLLPITVLALTLALGSLAWRARARWGYSPLVLGIVGAITLSVGQFVITSAQTTVIGAIVLMAAALWNALPRARNGASCADCVPRVPTERQR